MEERGANEEEVVESLGEGDRMQITYDPKYNVAYIRLREKTGEVETIRVSDEILIDISPDGKVYGIELLNANELLRLEVNGTLKLTNEATGESIEVPLASFKG